MYEYDLGIVIVNYNVRYFLAQCLQSIKNSQLQGLRIEVWVVDNASVDGSVVLLEKEYRSVRLIKNSINKGFAAANNQAISLMHSEYILLLNPDTVLEEDTLFKCHEYMKKTPGAGALGVRMIDGTGKFLPESKRKIPDLWNSFCKLFYLSDMFPKSTWFSGYNLGYMPENEINEVEVLCGAFMFIRSSVLDKVGLLDESFFMYGEDIDLSHRIYNAGYKIIYFPETSIVHFKGESTKKGSINYIRTFYGAMIIYVNKHYSDGSATLFTKFLKLAINTRASLSAISKILKPYLRLWIDFGIIYFSLLILKVKWAKYYFGDENYYANTNINLILSIYALLWVFSIWLTGHYDKNASFYKTLTGIFTGTVLLLIGYALLPENMRTSRAMIIIGIGVSLSTATFTRLIYNGLNHKYDQADIPKNIAVVASKLNALKLYELIKNVITDHHGVHFINPESLVSDPFFSNKLTNLESIISTLNITDVIYSSDDISFKEIIRSMSSIGSRVRFKIGGDDSLSMIGSTHRDKQGELYNFDLPYNLMQAQNLRFKRLTDIFFSSIFIPFFPVLYIICGFRLPVFKNIFQTFIGMKTFIGYGGEYKDFNFLPLIKKGVIKFPLSFKVMQFDEGYFKRKNIEYARNYSPWLDIKTIWANMYKLGNKK